MKTSCPLCGRKLENELLSQDEVAEMIGVSVRTVRRYQRTGRLGTANRKGRMTQREVLKFLEYDEKYLGVSK